jgi:hypothetical protein
MDEVLTDVTEGMTDWPVGMAALGEEVTYLSDGMMD